ncbi:copper resistance protein CopC [Streptomyces sp. NPDC020917]|uniref:copper resistance CopC/CopD family protein n=1 Tax=Streptomyces sp. NPDC020917 TaxID=3365102 RepID=UPI003793AF0F
MPETPAARSRRPAKTRVPNHRVPRVAATDRLGSAAATRRLGFAAVVRRLAWAAGLAVAALLSLPAVAAAHADLVDASPSDRAVLSAEPQQVTLVFSERVTLALSTVAVVAPNGHRVDRGAPTAAGAGGDRIRVRLAPERDRGTYVVAWRTTAADDGHTTSGQLTFSVGAPSRTGAAPAPLGGHDRLTDAFLDTAVWLGFAGLAGLVGFAAVRLYCLPDPGASRDHHEDGETAPPAWAGMRWPAAAGWGLLVTGTLVQLFLYGPSAQGESLNSAFDRSLLSSSLSSHVGHTLVARFLLLALIAAVGEEVLRHRRAGRAAAAVIAFALALTWSETSHAPAGPVAPLALTITTLHVTAMAVWAGGMACLVVLLTRGRDAALALAARRFSHLALCAVAVLAATGLYQAYREVGSLHGLTGTHYGRLVLTKATLFLLVVTVAARTHARVRRRREPASPREARRPILLELAGVTAVLVVTVLLISTAPAHVPRTTYTGSGGASPAAPQAPGASPR